jgi:pimeloyl-ACP methyl ester carboxylesterase
MRGLLRFAVRLVLVAVVAAALVLAGFRLAAARREQGTASDAPPGGRFVAAGDVRVFVQEAGPASGPGVLFVHGTGAWSEVWRDAMTTAADAGFHAVALDLPPFGFSERPANARYGKADQGRRIAAAVDALGLAPVVLVGHSFGGGPTVEAALLAPDRVRGLVLVDAALGLPAEGARPAPPPRLLSAALAVRPLRDAVVATFLTNPRFTKRLLQSFIADPANATPARVAIYQRPLGQKGSTAAIGQWLPALLAPAEAAPSEDPASYARLRMPVVLIWGGRDTITPLAQGQRLARLVKGARLVVMDAVGHIPQLEDPAPFDAIFAQALAGFP